MCLQKVSKPLFNGLCTHTGDDKSTVSDHDALQIIDEKLNKIDVQTAQSDHYNITDGK